MFLFALPSVVFAVLTNAVFPARHTMACFPGYIATVGLGACIFLFIISILKMKKKRNFKKYLCGVLFLSAYLLAIALFGMYGNGGAFLNEDTVTFNFLNIVLFTWVLTSYLFFKCSITDCLRTTSVSKTSLKKHMKGMKNYWWLEELHKTYNLGPVYYLNKALSALCALFLAFSILFGWFGFSKYISAVIFCAACVFCMFANFFSTAQYNLEEHGKPFVIFARNKRQGFDSVIFDSFAWFVSLLLIYVEWILLK